jgi:hypothetical protein
MDEKQTVVCRTEVINDNNDPVWNKKCEILLGAFDYLEFIVLDSDWNWSNRIISQEIWDMLDRLHEAYLFPEDGSFRFTIYKYPEALEYSTQPSLSFHLIPGYDDPSRTK